MGHVPLAQNDIRYIQPNPSIHFLDQGPANWLNSRQSIPISLGASINNKIVAVSRKPDTMEIFWFGVDGSLQDAYWYEGFGPDWRRLELAPANLTKATSQTHITAVSSSPETMEVFWVGTDGSIQLADWYEHPDFKWRVTEIAPAGSAHSYSPITAVSRKSGDINVFWVGPNNSVQSAKLVQPANPLQSSRWNVYEVAPANSVSPGGSLAAVSRRSDTMEVFWINPNGSIEDAYWYEGFDTNWQRLQIAPPGSTSNQSSIASISRKQDTMEVFWLGPNGSIEGAYWYEGFGPNWQRLQITPADSTLVSTPLSVVSRNPSTMELFWVNLGGALQNAYWYEGFGANWRRGSIAQGIRVIPTKGLATVSRKPDTMEIFWVGPDGSIQGAYWYEGFGPNWRTLEISPKGSTSV